MEVKIIVQQIDNLKTTTAIKVEKDKDGEVTDRRLVTKVQFEAEIDPAQLAIVHRLLASETIVNVVIGSPQAIMDLDKKKLAETPA